MPNNQSLTSILNDVYSRLNVLDRAVAELKSVVPSFDASQIVGYAPAPTDTAPAPAPTDTAPAPAPTDVDWNGGFPKF